MITLYTIGCVNCNILEKKLVQEDIQYKVCEDKDAMRSKGFDHLPILEVDGKYMGFKEAMKWINNRKETK